MWHSCSENQMEERLTECLDSKETNLYGDSSVFDSGILSSDNLQITTEIRDPASETGAARGDGDDAAGDNAAAASVAATVATATAATTATPAATVPATTTTTVAAAAATTTTTTTTTTTDSGVELGLSKRFSHLALQRVFSNSLNDDNGKVQPEPTCELTAVTTRPDGRAGEPSKQNRRPIERRPTDENTWQFYYMQDNNGDTQLHTAIAQGFAQAAFRLIKLAPRPSILNIMNDDWQSPLHLAVLTHQPIIVRRLILAGAEPSLRNFQGNTPLHVACNNGDLACAQALAIPLSPLERNDLISGQTPHALPQDLEQRNYKGEMCLHLAASHGYVDLVRFLIRLGANPNAREALAGRTALHLAVEHNYRTLIYVLLRECKSSSETETYAGMTAYQLALSNDIKLAKELVRLGAKPQPLPETDSENSEDEEASIMSYVPELCTFALTV